MTKIKIPKIDFKNLADLAGDLEILAERKLGLSCYGLPHMYYEGMVPHKMTLKELETYSQRMGLNIEPHELRESFQNKEQKLKEQYVSNQYKNLDNWTKSLRIN